MFGCREKGVVGRTGSEATGGAVVTVLEIGTGGVVVVVTVGLETTPAAAELVVSRPDALWSLIVSLF